MTAFDLQYNLIYFQDISEIMSLYEKMIYINFMEETPYDSPINTLPDLTKYINLNWICCRLEHFEPYMLDLDIDFEFRC